MRHKNGGYRNVEAVFVNLLDNPRIHGIIANYRDVTERRALEKQKDEFLAIASHELKTPMTSIKGYSQLLLETFEQSENQEAVMLIEKLEGQVERLTNLIKDLLDVTSIKEGQLKLRKVKFDINQLVVNVAEQIQRTTNIHVLTTSLKADREVWADKDRIEQVVANLLSNAVKYSPNGGKINITTKTEGDIVKVSVKDFGIGIDKQMKDKVFDRFARVTEPSTRTFPGLGLGLYIAREIIERHHGTIGVNSNKGKGSLFFFTLSGKKQ